MFFLKKRKIKLNHSRTKKKRDSWKLTIFIALCNVLQNIMRSTEDRTKIRKKGNIQYRFPFRGRTRGSFIFDRFVFF